MTLTNEIHRNQINVKQLIIVFDTIKRVIFSLSTLSFSSFAGPLHRASPPEQLRKMCCCSSVIFNIEKKLELNLLSKFLANYPSRYKNV